jgi:hypothetical protein
MAVLVTVLALAPASAGAQAAGDGQDSISSILAHFPAIGTGVSVDRLDTARRINDRRALAASFERHLASGEERREFAFYTRRTPAEVARRSRLDYGPDSFLARGANAVAAIASAAEQGTQASLNGVSTVAGGIVDGGGQLIGLPHLKVPRLSSKINEREVAIRLSTKW